MINTIAKLLLKSTGLFTAFVVANNRLDLKQICETLDKFDATHPNGYVAQLAFMFLCICIIYVGYYIFSDLAKTVSEGLTQLTKRCKDNKENKTFNELTEVLNRISYKLDRDNSRNYQPNTIDDPNRKMNEAMRPPRMM